MARCWNCGTENLVDLALQLLRRGFLCVGLSAWWLSSMALGMGKVGGGRVECWRTTSRL